jgi:MoxR-like ATPase
MATHDLEPTPYNPSALWAEFGDEEATVGAGVAASTPPGPGSWMDDVEQPVEESRTAKMLRTALRAHKFVVLSGLPGTGKGVTLRSLAKEVAQDPEAAGFAPDHGETWPDPRVVAPDETTGAFDLVGGHAPAADGSLVWKPGIVPATLAADRWLVLDELNRGELDRVLGPLLPWLAGERVELDHRVDDAGKARTVVLEWRQQSAHSGVDEIETEQGVRIVYYAGADFRLLGTYNPKDAERVFDIGRALGRRMKVVPISPLSEDSLAKIIEERFELDGPTVTAITDLYVHHGGDVVMRTGPAAFLDMAAYISASNEIEPLDPIGDGPAWQIVLAEAYLLNVGQLLKALPPEQLEKWAAADATVAAFGDDGWDLIRSGLQDLI